MPDISITYRNTSELIPYARNSRTHSEAQVAQIAGSIREFGFANPVLIDGENGIIAGHGRLLAAQKLNIDTIPCIVLDHLTKTQQRALVIADNKLAMNAGWDNEMLSLELGELKGLDVDLELIVFSAEELAAIGGATVEEVEFPGLPDGEKEPFQQQQARQVVSRMTVTKGVHAVKGGGGASMRQYIEAGFNPIPGFQLRYIYFLNTSAQSRLTVPIIPFGKIDEMGAGMYKGIKRDKQATAEDHSDSGGAAPTVTLQSL